MTTLDLEQTLAKIKSRQWVLADIDWDAPGAELVTEEQKPKLKVFMADLMWIEHLGARAFASMAQKAPNDTLREIYRYFHAEEQKHANAELALMRRWGLLDGDEVPLPKAQIAYTLDMVDKVSDRIPFEYHATSIPMLEVALDGALLKFLTDEIKDPLLNVVLNKVNADESRHLAVGFHVMGMLSGAPFRRMIYVAFKALSMAGVVRLQHLLGVLPLLASMREELFDLGMDGSRLSVSLERFRKASVRDPRLNNNPMYKMVRSMSFLTMERNPVLYRIERTMIRMGDRIPPERRPKPPVWSEELTWRATV
ncbi:hypothetical protein BST33_12710 [Mycolicibacter minnesotensis]|uniref:Uncharacterized protein n=1 Tax=Mycolicibacter minnesotensis TaxID=1118379 RepID=A0A7I7R4W4_9MYCO|nr:hypothetical protein [Mycolicibacter minnesotensis]ORA99937.1 hypothetical protein BST33_12710 [Mycolicibacter minnesotensis]BBY33631.1 hypothetical protein MMIN_16920 [Mycolicibacter minnesotensis]